MQALKKARENRTYTSAIRKKNGRKGVYDGPSSSTLFSLPVSAQRIRKKVERFETETKNEDWKRKIYLRNGKKKPISSPGLNPIEKVTPRTAKYTVLTETEKYKVRIEMLISSFDT